MKILFANAPVIRSKNSSAQNDFRVEGFIFRPAYRRIPGFRIISHMARLLGIGKGIRYGVRAGSRWPWTSKIPPGALHYPFIMCYAAANLQAHGYEAAVYDAVAEEEYSYDRFINNVKHAGADIVVLDCSTPTIDIDLWIAEKLSAFTQIALAGPHLASHAEQIQSENPHVSFFLKGEYILSALDMVKTLRPGIYDSIVVGDLDAIPFPFRDYPAAVKYYDPTMPTARPQLQIYASKGCPFRCTYCLWPQTMYQRKTSYRKPERVAEEIRSCVERYGYRSIFFDDDTFNVGTERVSKLCDELKEIGLPWTMMGRLDCSPLWLYDKMVECGCVGMRFGIETFDVQVLKNIKKGLESESLIETLQHISRKHHKLMIHVTMMKDLPGQSDDIHKKDMAILRDLGYSVFNKRRSYQLASCAPFPGTEMHDQLSKELGQNELDDFQKYDGGKDTIMKKLRKAE